MRRLYERNLITSRDGNASLRRSVKKTIYITPSGWRKTIIHPEHVLRLSMTDDGVEVPAGVTPSGELHMHYLILRGATQTRAVVHAHPTHIISAMYRGYDLQKVSSQFPEIFRYTRVGPSVAPIPAITAPLGDATAVALGVDGENLSFDIVGQHNHGVCAVAADPWTAYEHIERLDHICEILLLSGVTPEEVERRAARGEMHPG